MKLLSTFNFKAFILIEFNLIQIALLLNLEFQYESDISTNSLMLVIIFREKWTLPT